MPTITGRSNTGLFGAMLTVGRSCLGCMVSSRLAGVLHGGAASVEFNTPTATVAKRPLGGLQPAIGAMRCQPGVHCGSATPEKRTEIAAPVRIRRERAREDAMTIAAERRRWPVEGLTRVPYWVYSDRDVYADEQARIFRGPTWHF